MPDILRRLSRGLIALAIFVLALHGAPAFAQCRGVPPAITTITASWATNCARYYAPYALQAAAAYVSVGTFDQVRGPNGEPVLDGRDVANAVGAISPYADATTTSRATNYLRPWQYQFGSEGYLGCIDPTDTDCQKELGGWRFSVGGGPAFQVWARTHFPHTAKDACSEVSIAFRGTEGTASDWLSNFDPATHYFSDDYYLQLRRNINAIIRQISKLDCYKRAARHPQIVSVGHSLGGGLAQFAALANASSGPRIAKVFAFDPSPVTGAPLINKQTLSNNAKELEIDRVYETGEVLARVRQYYEQFPKSSSPCMPLVRTVTFEAWRGPNAIEMHGMAPLASQIVQLSYDADIQQSYQVPAETNCRTRYRRPTTDDYQVPVPSVYPGETVYRSDGSAMAAAEAHQYVYGFRSGGRQIVLHGTATRVKHRTVATPSGKRLSGVKPAKGYARHFADIARDRRP
jgi:pimeloyl-ACP methyl ester carboxylesterase